MPLPILVVDLVVRFTLQPALLRALGLSLPLAVNVLALLLLPLVVVAV
jgi:hypothetical protein